MNPYDIAVKNWEDDVNGEAARRIEQGIPPREARKQAEDYICSIRRAKARERDQISSRKEKPE